MPVRDTTAAFGSLTRCLHWVITVLILGMLGLGWYMSRLPDASPLHHELVGLHKSTGVVVLALVVVLVVWRLFNPRPSNADLPVWQRILSRITHFGLYAVILVQPISGIIMTVASGHNVSVYGWFSLPQFLSKDKALAGPVHTLHVWLPWAIATLIGLHMLAALYHHFVRRDGVLRRMLSGAHE